MKMSPQKVGKNKVVYFTYSILDEQRRVVEQHDVPVPYLHGNQSGLLHCVENGLDGRAPGERVEVQLPPEEGFGVHDPSLIYTDDLDNVPPQYRRLGAQVLFENEQGETKEFRVVKIEGGRLTLDGNHPMAGQTATCVVNILEVRDATAEEIARGAPDDHTPLRH
jgi:FKBP-type peptidyl-prolyl cis-trans isomerase SlyD